MASGCIASSTAALGRVPVRATYTNLFKWPESDAEFVRSVSSAGSDGIGGYCYRGGSGKYRVYGGSSSSTKAVDSYSCRQMYLRSYTFSRKEMVREKTRKCLATVKENVAAVAGHGKRKGSRARRLKEVSCSALCSVFRRLLSCTASVDVVDDRRRSF